MDFIINNLAILLTIVGILSIVCFYFACNIGHIVTPKTGKEYREEYWAKIGIDISNTPSKTIPTKVGVITNLH